MESFVRSGLRSRETDPYNRVIQLVSLHPGVYIRYSHLDETIHLMYLSRGRYLSQVFCPRPGHENVSK